jgi:Helitron helicase-like domain at N-terminus
MNITCVHCGAYHWLDERLKNSSKTSPLFSHCCHSGKVRLLRLPDPPEPLHSLLTATSTEAKEFRESIRQYNCALAFTSFTAKEEDVNSGGGGPWVWKTGYTIYHRAGSLFADVAARSTYAQLYFYDAADALCYRMNRNYNLDRDTMYVLQDMLLQHNRYARMFSHAFEVLERTPARELGIRILADPSTDLRRYNAPTVDEIAVILPGNQDRAMNPRDIILHPRCGGGMEFIHDHHAGYAPLHYVLLFPYGTDGWTYGIQLHVATPPNRPEHEKHVTQVQYYSYRLHTREDEFPIIQCGGRLFQQWICDMWVSTDQNRLRWVETHQPELRAALYSGLEDAVGSSETDVNLHDIGHRVVLPSSYVGGPRYMNQRFQDAIALARHYHGFDLFITFTCNAQWADLTNALLPGQSAADRPDLIVRVFNLYKTALIDELTKKSIFGETLGYVHTIEFQKRGLPHMHLLLALTPRFRPTTIEDVDTMIKASWPDPVQEPALFNVVKRCMVHGPCGQWNPQAKCMKDGVCSKGFPKPFQEQTVMTRNGYPTYARPNDGRAYDVRGFSADNRWIVPYNPYLLSRYVHHFSPQRLCT